MEKTKMDSIEKERVFKQSITSIPPMVLMELVKDIIGEGNQPLGILPFAWSQPLLESENEITLGSVYTSHNGEYSINDLLKPLVENGELWEWLDVLKPYIRNAKKYSNAKDHNDTKIEFNCILSNEEISIPFSEMDIHERMIYKFSIMWINIMNEFHDFSCEFLESMAYAYIYSDPNHSTNWRVYESSNPNDELLGEILEIGCESPLNISSYELDYNDPSYNHELESLIESHNKKYWESQLENIFGEDYKELSIEFIFGDFPKWDYQTEEVFGILFATLDELENAWKDGSLKLTLSNNLPTNSKKFLKEFYSQPLLPTIASQLVEDENE